MSATDRGAPVTPDGHAPVTPDRGAAVAVTDDAVAGLLQRLRFQAGHGAVRLLARGQRTAGSGPVLLHQVTGSVTVATAGACSVLTAGDAALLPGDADFTLTGIDDGELLVVALHPREEIGATSARPVLDGGLPAVMLAADVAAGSPLATGVFAGLLDELADPGGPSGPGEAGEPGEPEGPSAAARLSLAGPAAEVAVAVVVRAWAASGCAAERGGWRVALRDPHIARAVEAIQSEPGTKWSVAELARVANASRSVFAEQFREVVGEPPLRYLARVRMERAKQLLVAGGFSVGQTAEALGYCSDVAFSRAFRRVAGQSPSGWRASALGTPSATAPAAASGIVGD